ncbi:hypothetical protein [Morganella morganii]|uniref:hypothetical protein n=1 Tax=Morganella morganii TaxID=582 RepID=UPI00298E5FD0|nr:hypothetical protein [Morganella morganii]MDW7783352.1 hypothetical protein [Morganella morganii]MDW7789227.1 hypothetical protein [Morganella morganii]
MPNAYCLCPDFLVEKISDPSVFTNVFICHLINEDHQIIIDDNEELIALYQEKAAERNNETFRTLQVWLTLIDRGNGKILHSAPSSNCNVVDETYRYIYNITAASPTTFNKAIIANDNIRYAEFIEDLSRQHINLYNLQNLNRRNELSGSNLCYHELDKNILWILQRLQRSYNNKKSEDELNDYVRDLLKAQKYSVSDQSREGVSSSGVGTGELDLIIEDDGILYSIIEPMKLKSLDKGYIDTHYKKLLINYNPLCVKRTFLITYYTGDNLSSWWGKYIDYIESIDDGYFGDLINIGNVEVGDTGIPNIKKLNHHMLVNQNEHIACIHYVVKIPKEIR